MDPGLLLAVPIALCAAASFGAAAALQQRAARSVPEAGLASPRLLLNLLEQRGFVLSLFLAGFGFLMQAAALRFGPLTLVQPVLVTGTLFYIAFSCVVFRARPDIGAVFAAILAMAGLSAFILIAQPTLGGANFDTSGAIPLAIGLVLVVGACLVLATRLKGDARVLPLAVATAVCYGVSAALLRSLSAGFTGDVVSVVGRWQLYALAVVGVAGFSLNQQAYQKGLLGTVAVATITVGDPAVSIGTGIAWLGESIRGGPLATLGEVLSLLAVAAGILLLFERSHRITQLHQERAPSARARMGSGSGEPAPGEAREAAADPDQRASSGSEPGGEDRAPGSAGPVRGALRRLGRRRGR